MDRNKIKKIINNSLIRQIKDKKVLEKNQLLVEEIYYKSEEFRGLKLENHNFINNRKSDYDEYIKVGNPDVGYYNWATRQIRDIDKLIKINKDKYKVDIEELKTKKVPYRDVDAINFSSLAAISVGPQFYKSRVSDTEDKEHFIIGSCVDCLLTEPNKFDDYYVVEEDFDPIKIPKAQMKKYVETYVETNDSDKAFEIAGFKRDNILKVIERYAEEGKEYAEYLLRLKTNKNSDKQIISNSQYELCKKIVNSFKQSRFTNKYFIEPSGNIEVLNQHEIYWEMLGRPFKCKVDKIIIDNDRMSIQPLDIKTTGKHVSKFVDSFLSFRYDIQASLYMQGIMAYFWQQNPKYKNYRIPEFKFIVESTKYIGSPLIFRVPSNIIDLSYEGFYTTGNTYHKGWRRLINDLEWHKETNIWDYSKEDFEKEGEIEIRID